MRWFEFQASKRWEVGREKRCRASRRLYSTRACQTLASVCGKEQQRPPECECEWAASNFEELKSGWSEFTAHQGSSQSKESTQRFQKLLERTPPPTPPPSTPPTLYYVTSAVVSIKNTVVLFSKVMKLLTLVLKPPSFTSLVQKP